jgi:hypothetical protein
MIMVMVVGCVRVVVGGLSCRSGVAIMPTLLLISHSKDVL